MYAPAFDAEVLVDERGMEALDDAVGLRPLDRGGVVFDVFELQEEFVGILVGAAAELAAIVGQDNIGPAIVFLEGGITSWFMA